MAGLIASSEVIEQNISYLTFRILTIMPRPRQQPIGLALGATAKRLGRAFDDALVKAGGSRPTWLILLALKTQPPQTQRELAAAVGIEGATLTHHLGAMQRAGLVTRERPPENRRVQRIELTEEGERIFLLLRAVAQQFDTRIRAGLSDEDIERLRGLLATLDANSAAS
jgi:MarR family transcriptional regulator, transcriptional regulator for hemolysin